MDEAEHGGYVLGGHLGFGFFYEDVASGYDVGGDDPDGFVVEFGGSQFVG